MTSPRVRRAPSEWLAAPRIVRQNAEPLVADVSRPLNESGLPVPRLPETTGVCYRTVARRTSKECADEEVLPDGAGADARCRPNVLLAMAQPMIHHRTPEYEALFIEVRAGLKRLFQTSQDVISVHLLGHGQPWRPPSSARSRPATPCSCCGRASSASAGRRSAQAYGAHRRPAHRALRRDGARRSRRRGLARASRSQGGADAAQRVVHGRAPRRARASPRSRAPTARDPDRRRGVEPRHRRSADGRVGRRRGRGRLAEGADAAARACPSAPCPRRRGATSRPRGCRSTTSTSRPSGSAVRRNEAHFTPAVSIVVGLREVLRMIETEGLAERVQAPRAAGARHALRRGGARARALREGARRAPRSPRCVAPRGVDSEAVARHLLHLAQHHHRGRAGGDEGQGLPPRPHGLRRRLRRASPRSPRSSRCSTSWGIPWTSAPRVRRGPEGLRRARRSAMARAGSFARSATPETDWNRERRYQGWTDTASVRRRGAARRRRRRRLLARRAGFAAVWSSPLRRARDTAAAIARPHGLAVRGATRPSRRCASATGRGSRSTEVRGALPRRYRRPGSTRRTSSHRAGRRDARPRCGERVLDGLERAARRRTTARRSASSPTASPAAS